VQSKPRPQFADPVVRYMADCGEVQERFRQILTQLAGFALLITTRRVERSVWSGPLDIAEDRAMEAGQLLRALRPPGEARHHFHHLAATGEAIERALAAAHACLTMRAGEADRDDLMRALRTATEHLRASTRLLPGFELVDLRQACCAVHAAPPTLSCAAIAV
jgi:hypothetical protein